VQRKKLRLRGAEVNKLLTESVSEPKKKKPFITLADFVSLPKGKFRFDGKIFEDLDEALAFAINENSDASCGEILNNLPVYKPAIVGELLAMRDRLLRGSSSSTDSTISTISAVESVEYLQDAQEQGLTDEEWAQLVDELGDLHGEGEENTDSSQEEYTLFDLDLGEQFVAQPPAPPPLEIVESSEEEIQVDPYDSPFTYNELDGQPSPPEPSCGWPI